MPCHRRPGYLTVLHKGNYRAPPRPQWVAAVMSAHSKTPYITPSMEFSSGKGVVRGRRGQQLECTLLHRRGLRESCRSCVHSPKRRAGPVHAKRPVGDREANGGLDTAASSHRSANGLHRLPCRDIQHGPDECVVYVRLGEVFSQINLTAQELWRGQPGTGAPWDWDWDWGRKARQLEPTSNQFATLKR